MILYTFTLVAAICALVAAVCALRCRSWSRDAEEHARHLKTNAARIGLLHDDVATLERRFDKLAGRYYREQRYDQRIRREEQPPSSPPPMNDTERRDELRRQLLPKSHAARIQTMRDGVAQKE